MKATRLVAAERDLIHDAQSAKLVARNFKHMAHPITPRRDSARLLRRHPEVLFEPTMHKEFGPGVSLLHVDGLTAMKRPLDDVEVTRAAATVALRLNRIGKSM